MEIVERKEQEHIQGIVRCPACGKANLILDKAGNIPIHALPRSKYFDVCPYHKGLSEVNTEDQHPLTSYGFPRRHGFDR